MRNEANKEVMIKMEEIKKEIIDHVEQAEERLRRQIAEGNEQIMGTLQELRKQMLPPLLATVKQHGQSPPPQDRVKWELPPSLKPVQPDKPRSGKCTSIQG